MIAFEMTEKYEWTLNILYSPFMEHLYHRAVSGTSTSSASKSQQNTEINVTALTKVVIESKGKVSAYEALSLIYLLHTCPDKVAHRVEVRCDSEPMVGYDDSPFQHVDKTMPMPNGVKQRKIDYAAVGHASKALNRC